jgi:uncharacterized membrane protein
MKIDKIITAIIIIELLLCVYSASTTTSNNLLCSVKSSCDLVQSSSFSHVLGIKLSIFAIFAFLLLLLSWIERDKKIFYYSFFVMSLIGALLALIYISLQIFVIKAICESCIIIDTLAIILYIVVIFKESRENKIQSARIKFK